MTYLVPTANVVITFGKDTTKKLFKKGATFSNLTEALNSDGSLGLLFNTQSNPNFISFQHDVAVGKNFEMTLSLIDPSQEFEKQFLTTNVLENTAYIFDTGHTANSNIQGSLAQQRTSSVAKKLKSDIKPQTEAINLVKKNRRELYISYGVGNDLNLWAGPFKVIIANIDIKIEGSRVLTLKFAPIDNALDAKAKLTAYNKPVEIDSQGITIGCDGYSNEIDFFGKKAYDPHGSNLVIDYHYLIVDTIRSYIQNATQNPNVIVLLPDLNKVCKKHIDLWANISRYSTIKPSSLGSLIGGKQLGKVFGNAYGYDQEGKLENFLNNLLGSFGLTLSVFNKKAPFLSLVTGVISSRIPPEKFNKNLKDYYDQSIFRAKVFSSSKTGVPDHLHHLGSVISKINQCSKAETVNHYDIKYDYMVENNMFVLDTWATDTELKCSDFPLFSGKDKLIPDKEVIIFGDVALIHFLLYGGDSSKLGKFLHPLDAKILLNPKYKEKILQNIPSYKNYVFGDITKAPDDFAYLGTSGLLNEQEKDLLKTENIPVFTYNTQNPNVYELNLKDSGQYFSFLRAHHETVVYRKAAAILGGVIPSDIVNVPITDAKALFGYAINAGYYNQGVDEKKKLQIAEEIARKSDSVSIPYNPEYIATQIVTILDQLSSDHNLGLRTLFKQWLACDPAMIVGDFLNQIYNKAYQLNIATIPLFKISNLLDLSKPCLVFMQHTNMPMIQQPKESLLGVIYSGAYRIMGYRHTIDFSKCYSEFMLTKIISSGKKSEPENFDLSKYAIDASALKQFKPQDTWPIPPSTEVQGPPAPSTEIKGPPPPPSSREQAIKLAEASRNGYERRLVEAQDTLSKLENDPLNAVNKPMELQKVGEDVQFYGEQVSKLDAKINSLSLMTDEDYRLSKLSPAERAAIGRRSRNQFGPPPPPPPIEPEQFGPPPPP